jgi:Na+/melibiose symporter-like transporter
MASVGAVLLIVRVFDAFFDPADLALMADRNQGGAWHAARPWIRRGVPLWLARSGRLLLYPRHRSTSPVVTLFVRSLVLYLGWSTFEIPHNAWVDEPPHPTNSRRTTGILDARGGVLHPVAW